MTHVFQRAAIAAVILTMAIPTRASLTQSTSNLSIQDSNTKQAVPPAPLVTLKFKDMPLEEALKAVASQVDIGLLYNRNDLPLQKKVSLTATDISMQKAFDLLLESTGLIAEIKSSRQVVIRKAPADTGRATQQKTGSVHGSVIDSATGAGLPGVNVQIVGESGSTITNQAGYFLIEGVEPGTRTLTIRLLGYTSTTEQVQITENGRALVRVSLRPAATALNEVVTTATGSQRRVEIPNDIAKIDAEKIMARAPVRSLTDLLEAAQVPGVLVQRSSGDPGAPSRIRIRGIGSISEKNDPVIIIDGVWVDASAEKPSRIDDIDPSTIETMEIVRGASAATLYGQDAANGVIVITTKKGQAGPTRWNLSYNRDWGSVPGTRPVFYEGWGHDPIRGTSRKCNIRSVLQRDCIQDTVVVIDPNHPLLKAEGSAVTNRYTLAVDGGAAAIRYAITGSIQEELGARRAPGADLIRMRQTNFETQRSFLEPNHLNRRSISANFTMNPGPKSDLAIMLSGTQNQLRDNRYSGRTPGVKNQDAAWTNSLDTLSVLDLPSSITESSSSNKSFSSLLSIQGTYRPVTWSQIRGQGGFERITQENGTGDFVYACKDALCVDSTGARTARNINRNVYTMRLQATARPSLGKADRFLEIWPSLGGDLRKNESNTMLLARTALPRGERSLLNGDVRDATYTTTASATAGWYINSTIGLFRRLYFDIGLRQDIGSAITSSSNTRYPKLGTSWLVSDESFWPVNEIFNTLRLRGALGHSAVHPEIADISGSYTGRYAWVGGKFVEVAFLNSIGNTILQPERATEVELGIDADMLYDRVQLGLTYSQRENRNTLVNRELAPSSGVETPRKENIARVRNRTLELSLNGRAVDSRDILLVINYNMTLLENVVKKLGEGVSPFTTTNSSRIEAGYPIGGSWARNVLGYKDLNGDNLISRNEMILSDSLVYLGWSQPRYRANYGASLTLYNSITFDTRLAYQSRYVQHLTLYGGLGTENIHASFQEQALAQAAGLTGAQTVSDLRLNSASVTYQIRQVWLERLRARSLYVSLQGSNLALWTNYSGRDPGVNSSTFTERLSDDGRITPRPRQFVLSFRWGL